MRVDLIRVVAVSGAVATAMLASRPIGPISAQSLAAPTFTAAQQNAGDAIYKESCASCHGKNLDDGEFGPPLKGVEFRSAWFGRPAGVLFTTIETMPPAHRQRSSVRRIGHRQRWRPGGDVPGARAGDQESAGSRRNVVGIRAARSLEP